MLFCMVVCICSISSASEHDNGRMTLTLKGDGFEIVFYQGPPKKSIMLLLQDAHTSWFKSPEKAAVEEGEYFIEIYDGVLHRKYSIQNNYWIYDYGTDTIVRCAILNELRGLLLQYLLEQRNLGLSAQETLGFAVNPQEPAASAFGFLRDC